MNATRYAPSRRLSPAGLTGALMATAAVIAGLVTAAPKIVTQKVIDILVADPIEAPKPPPPQPEPKPETKRPQTTRSEIQRVDPLIKVPADDPIAPIQTVDLARPVDPGLPLGNGDGGVIVPLPKPPVLVKAQVDPRYSGDFQPYYPPSERYAGREGRVVVRVLIGTDGRVHDVERVSATTDAFFEATRKRALERWRFQPATRDGTPVESWQEMGVTFRLEQD